MKLILSILANLLVVSIIGTSSVMACSVAPVNEVFQKNDLAAQGLSKMGISIENVVSVEIDSYSGEYIWTPMCPKGLKSKANLKVSYVNPEETLSKGCVAEIEVYKNWIYEEGGAVYVYNIKQVPNCLE